MSILRDARPRFRTLLIAVVIAACARNAAAQSVQWRTDYNAARKEATEKGWPILLDFGTENCMWCKKLEFTTFRDPSIVSLVNEHFVALKVDAERETILAQTLRIQTYPTLVVAGP